MLLLLNVLWIILGGLVIALEYLVVGVVLCLTLIGIPFGLQCFKLAGLALWPFGREARLPRRRGAAEQVFASLFNILWFLFAGLWIFLSHLVLAVGLMITIIGIPFALQHLKLAGLALLPFGREVGDIPPPRGR